MYRWETLSRAGAVQAVVEAGRMCNEQRVEALQVTRRVEPQRERDGASPRLRLGRLRTPLPAAAPCRLRLRTTTTVKNTFSLITFQ